MQSSDEKSSHIG